MLESAKIVSFAPQIHRHSDSTNDRRRTGDTRISDDGPPKANRLHLHRALAKSNSYALNLIWAGNHQSGVFISFGPSSLDGQLLHLFCLICLI